VAVQKCLERKGRTRERLLDRVTSLSFYTCREFVGERKAGVRCGGQCHRILSVQTVRRAYPAGLRRGCEPC